MHRFFLALCAFAFLFITATPGQDKKSDLFGDDDLSKFFAGTQIRLEIATLNAKKSHLKLKLSGYEMARDILREWKKMAEKELAKFNKEEKEELPLIIQTGQRLVQILGPKKMNEEVFPVAAAAFGVGKIAKPTELQQKIIARASKEKDEAKRIALTIRECLRYTAEDDALLKKEVAQIDQQISKRRKLLPEPKKGEKKTKKK